MLDRILGSLSKYQNETAFCIGDKIYTYKDLSRKVACIQYEIELKQIEKENRVVGLICNNDIETYASIFALWFSGMAYVPISLKNPRERNSKIIADAGVKVILSSMQVADFEGLDFIDSTLCRCTDDMPHINSDDASNLAYILFTSGSTGVPKGVPISQKNLASFVTSFENLGIDLKPADRCLQMFELTFDVSVACFLLPVLKGASIYTIPPNGIKYLNVVRTVRDFKLSFVTIVPSILTLLKPYFKQLIFEDVRCCILTAEATYTDMLQPLQKIMPAADIWNLYGPTEATIWCTGLKYDTNKVKQYNGMFAIGKPLQNVGVVITDERFNKVDVMQKGELCLTGDQITDGYLNNPETNRRAFKTHSSNALTARYYRTGDFCYMDEEGDIFYCGRMDNQVQMQGFRVELSEIEITIREQFNINNVVLAINNKLGVPELVLVLESNSQDFDEVKDFMSRKLPYYMIPEKIIRFDEFPVNNSGKVDRIKLKTLL